MTDNLFGAVMSGVEKTDANIKKIMKMLGSRADAEALKIAVSATIEAEAKRTSPLRTGAYRRSIRTYAGTQGDRVLAVMSSDKIYAPVIEEGSKAHKIEPRRKQALAFNMRVGSVYKPGVSSHGRALYLNRKTGKLTQSKKKGITIVKHTMHPGTKAYHIFERATETKKHDTTRAYGSNLNRMIKRAVA